MELDDQHLGDYLAILKRRRAQVIKPAVLVFVSALILAVALPSVYRSTATILIEQQEIPTDMIRSTVTGYAQQRLKIITTRLLTDENLTLVVESLGLFKEERSDGKLIGVLNEIREGIVVESVSANVTDPRSGRATKATIAFDISFDAKDPNIAQQVTSELVKLYLNENTRIRTEKAEATSGFLSDEQQKIKEKVLVLEGQLAQYKKENVEKLPEMRGLNMKLIERSERDLETAQREIYNLEERKVYLESQIAQIEPFTGQSPAARLKELQTKYISTSSVYAVDHPDLVRMRREISALKSQIGIVDDREIIARKTRESTNQLRIMKEKYSDDHPDVIKLKQKIKRLRRRLNSMPETLIGLEQLKPDNPAYISVKNQIVALEIRTRATREKIQRSRQKLTEYEARLTDAPKVEQAGAELTREYKNALREYQDIQKSLVGANRSVELERLQKGETFTLLEPATLPSSPEKPNRKAIILLGLVLGIGVGVGYASIAEYMDRSIRGSRAVADIFGEPPLASIPHFQFNA